ncbi:benzoate/H(+) symporter BenE family transporter (plasmid) [Deinococcus taeanensis]|uniref:benzoate/H(+) symporter BenE family transporter n=1 Tax=Deinococcus taeanensis TaxID=2737050 RepID=UPI001CDC24A0|nr:benzoate/H(+) symporter BenE family transporter [Deinococcus taeanensis]UBV44510.1 benzoate/H(+) symporter BenE family transporter [Deinococcus taeanensis]
MTGRAPSPLQDLAAPLLAGLIAVLVSASSNLPLFMQLFTAAHFTPAQSVSSLSSMYLALAVLGAALCLRYRAPIILGWNTAGIAVLIAEGPHFTPGDIVGALLVSAVTLTVLGLTGLFDRLARKLPPPLAAALLAGVLLPFVLRGMAAVPAAPALLVPMFAAYLLGRAFLPRWAVPFALLAGLGAAALTGELHPRVVHPLGALTFTQPTFNLRAILAIAVPSVVFAVASQNLPGLAILHASGYRSVPARPLVTLTGAAGALASLFGSITLNLGAITAAICTGPDAHPDPARRFIAGLSCAAGYLGLALCGGALLGLAGAFPAPLLQGLAGLALLGPLMSGREGTLAAEPHWREGALLTLVITASGMTWLGLSGAVWGLALGWGLAWLRGRQLLSHEARRP